MARLLQELKSRSGLSYGALAKRLHVSTSALHRYCTGDVMPVEFDPLERLARLCRATPEERTELYRLWVVAHTSRGNRQASVPAPAPKAPPAVPVTAPETEAALETAPETVPVPEPETKARPAGEGVVEVGTAARARTPAVSPHRRVRRGVLAAVTAAAVLAALGAVATGLKTRTGGDPTSAPAPAADAGSPAPLPTPGAAPVAADVTPSGPTGAADRGASAPITVTVRPHRDAECDRYVIDRPPSEVPPPPAVVDAPAWAAKVGAVPGTYQSIELTVQGTGSDTVVLTALNVRIARIAAPLAWNAYSMFDGCGGGMAVHSFDLDLDAARPRPVVTDGSTGLPLKVSERDPEVIEVTAQTTSHDVSWYLELEWSSGNRKGTLTIGPGAGTSFRTSAIKGRPLYRYPTGGKAWEPSPFQQ
ncbi:helix-turn-helix domain-containing protein [Streptomyces kaniharaensis]|uniref:Helix-turn-helix domain-containing protein n=1 Tax=Streptomyces kaniharaensis TaxID=212423 RepID=A0A6N7L0L0_9ACTN|nr:helix-turn-helix domain-containing protein [Streptomyces kaniharaensis]